MESGEKHSLHNKLFVFLEVFYYVILITGARTLHIYLRVHSLKRVCYLLTTNKGVALRFRSLSFASTFKYAKILRFYGRKHFYSHEIVP